jgi:hypothetical protein
VQYDLPRLTRARGIRRDVTLRPIQPTKAMANRLAAILQQTVSHWQAALPRIMAAYDPQTRDALTEDTIPGLESILATISGEVERAMIVITAQLREWSLQTERWHRGKWIGAVNGGTGIDLSSMLLASDMQETLGAWLGRNVALVRDVSEQTRGRIADIVFREWQNGTPPRQVGKMLDDAVGLGRDRSRRIAADQSLKLSSQLDRERQVEAGIDLVKWRRSGKLHARPWHLARNGKVFDIRTGKPVDGGERIPPDDRAGVPPFCGCVEQAHIPWLDEVV